MTLLTSLCIVRSSIHDLWMDVWLSWDTSVISKIFSVPARAPERPHSIQLIQSYDKHADDSVKPHHDPFISNYHDRLGIVTNTLYNFVMLA